MNDEEERETGWQEEMRHNRTLAAIVGVCWAIFVVACLIIWAVDV